MWNDFQKGPVFEQNGVGGGISAEANDSARKRNERLQILSGCLVQLLSKHDPDQIVTHIFPKVAAHVGADAFFNYLTTPETCGLDLRARIGIAQETVCDICQACSGGPLYCLAARTRSTVVAEDIQHSQDPRFAKVRTMGVQTCVCIPLLMGERLLGILSFASRTKRRFAPDEIQFLELISGYIAIAMDRAQAEQVVVEAKRTAEAASHTKDEFIATLSHELRTPLTPALITATSLEQDEAIAPAVREQIGIIRRNVELEARLIDDLLDLTRMERGKLSLRTENVDVHETLAQTLEIVRESILLKRQRFDFAPEAQRHIAEADPARLQQLFWNVLRNAVKFTPEGGSIHVRTFNPAPGSLSVEVRDTGVGIEPEHLERIFTPFDQGAANSQRYGGLGLGLAIARSIAELHHGSIAAASEGKDRGATFTVQIPASSLERLPAKPAARDAGRRAAHLHILLVEDNEQTRQVLTKILARDGHDVHAAPNFAAAVKAIRETREVAPFQVLISDIGLPDGSGLNLVRELKTGTSGLIAIALSGYGTREDIDRSIQAGFTTHLTKPISIEDLRRALAA